MGLPARTVSFKIKKALKELRHRLTEAGFAAVSDQALTTQIQHAICSGQALPEVLTQCPLMQQSFTPTSPGNEVVLWAQRISLPILLSIAACLCATTGYFLITNPLKLNHKNQPTTLMPESKLKSTQAPPNLPQKELFHQVWTFEGPASDKNFNVLSGKWKHKFVKDGKGVMKMNSDILLVEVLHALRLPLKLTIRARPFSAQGRFLAGGLFSEDRTPVYGTFRNATKISEYMGESEFVHYISDRFVDGWVDQKRVTMVYIHQHSYDRFALAFRGRSFISHIEIEEIEEDALPDLSEYKAAINRIPPAKRVGSVIIPEMRSVHPTQPVHIDFVPVPSQAKTK